MKYEFKPDNLGVVGLDQWMNASIRLYEVVGKNPFTVKDIIQVFKINGESAMTFLTYMVQHGIVRWLG